MASLTIDWERLPHREKFDRLFSRFRELKQVLVAYSGGVDSTLLLKVGTLALGEDCLGVIARSETLTGEEFEAAMSIGRKHGFNLRVIEYSELEIEHYTENPTNRCYYCKHELFQRLSKLTRELGWTALADGTNADDAADWRPGIQAAEEWQVLSPLREVGLHKQEIRDLAHAFNLPNWNKPPAPCLASRIAFGLRINQERLRQVAEGEKFLRQQGFRIVRVRHHDELASIEVAPEEIGRLFDADLRAAILAHLLELGFRHVTVDLQGYRMGSLNPKGIRNAE